MYQLGGVCVLFRGCITSGGLYNNSVYAFIEITLFQVNKAKTPFRDKGLRETYKGNILKYAEELADKLKIIYNKLKQSLIKV